MLKADLNQKVEFLIRVYPCPSAVLLYLPRARLESRGPWVKLPSFRGCRLGVKFRTSLYV
jgi:hypothetical protein